MSRYTAEDFKDYRNFATASDARHDCEAYYCAALEECRDYTEIHISASDVWSARTRRGHVESYEKIGYHARTSALMRAFLDSGLPIYVHRLVGGVVSTTRIQ